MDRAFLARLLIASAGILIVSVDSLIVLGKGIRGRERVIVLSKKIPCFYCGVGRECELGELSEFYEFF